MCFTYLLNSIRFGFIQNELSRNWKISESLTLIFLLSKNVAVWWALQSHTVLYVWRKHVILPLPDKEKMRQKPAQRELVSDQYFSSNQLVQTVIHKRFDKNWGLLWLFRKANSEVHTKLVQKTSILLFFDLLVTPLCLVNSCNGCQPIRGINWSSDCSGNMQIAVSNVSLVATHFTVATDQPCLTCINCVICVAF